MPADNELDSLDRWLNQQVVPLLPPSGTFEVITGRARRRKVRKAVISVASAAAVAAVVGVAVPLGMSMHLSASQEKANLAAGSYAKANPQPGIGTGSPEPRPAASSATLSAGATVSASASAGYLPADYVPSSVTWDSLSTGWVIGPAGTPGQCANANPYVCTSLARTDDGGQTWSGLPAPDTGGPMAATGVTGLRFLNGMDGWAYGPELWATDDGGEHWHKVNTGGLAVTDLETASGRAYALFGNCTAPRGTTGTGTTGDTIANCTGYTLKTASAGSDTWTPVGGIPANLGLGAGERASAAIELGGATSTEPATGYLVGPDATLYAGALDGSAWHAVAKLPCGTGAAAGDGLPQDLLLAPDGATSVGVARLAMVCVQSTRGGTAVYLSTDRGATWAQRSNVGSTATVIRGAPQSLTTLPDGTLVLATAAGSGQPGGGIYLLSPAASQWQAASLSDPSGKTYGFTYVGMTSATQGVALGGNPDLHAIWMTSDGGRTWQVRPIQG